MLSAAALQAQATTSTTSPIDINTASRVQLADAGWGQYADAIIAARPYKSMNDLVEKKVVPAKAYKKGSDKFEIGKGTMLPQDPIAGSATPSTNQPGATAAPSTGTSAAPASGASNYPAK
jgi:hypothetical protein